MLAEHRGHLYANLLDARVPDDVKRRQQVCHCSHMLYEGVVEGALATAVVSTQALGHIANNDADGLCDRMHSRAHSLLTRGFDVGAHSFNFSTAKGDAEVTRNRQRE